MNERMRKVGYRTRARVTERKLNLMTEKRRNKVRHMVYGNNEYLILAVGAPRSGKGEVEVGHLE